MPFGLKRAGLPVSHSTARKDAKTLPTTNKPLVRKRSLAFSQPMISPCSTWRMADFARANQPLIVMLIERRKFNRALLQGCDEWPWIRRDTGAGHRFALIKTGSDLAGTLQMS